MKSSKDASEGSLELIPGAALPEKTLSNLETFIQYSYLSAMIYIVCVKRRGREETEAGFGTGTEVQISLTEMILSLLFQKSRPLFAAYQSKNSLYPGSWLRVFP